MANQGIAILGASSFVGNRILALLQGSTWQVFAYSRRQHEHSLGNIQWRNLMDAESQTETISTWICVAPIWKLPDYFTLLEKFQVRRIVAVSSTSRFTKNTSTDPNEQALVAQLIHAEHALQTWAETLGIEWVVLRPTLIYGYGQDKNISEIARFIKRFRFFPVFGAAQGLRQPIHADDVAQACLQALHTSQVKNKAYNISGDEILTYRDMVGRVFSALNYRSRIITVPITMFRVAICCLRLLPRYKCWNSAMAERMNQDLVFDHNDAIRDFGFNPNKLLLTSKDLP